MRTARKNYHRRTRWLTDIFEDSDHLKGAAANLRRIADLLDEKEKTND